MSVKMDVCVRACATVCDSYDNDIANSSVWLIGYNINHKPHNAFWQLNIASFIGSSQNKEEKRYQ